MRNVPPRLGVLGLWAGLLTGVVAGQAQMIPADSVLQGFEPVGDWIVEVQGSERNASVYESKRAGSALLVLSEAFSAPVLLLPRQLQVQQVAEEKVARREDGRIDILSDAAPATVGRIELALPEVRFDVDGRPGLLKPRPYPLGLIAAQDLRARDAGYDFGARSYDPSAPILRQLRGIRGPVRVRVFFGSWCPHCKEVVPRMLRIAEELAGSPIAFEFYGLPRPFGDEPEAARAGIRSVPTGVVYRDGKEIARIGGAEFKIPELALKKALG